MGWIQAEASAMEDENMFREYDSRALLILGAGGLGEEVAEIARMSGLYSRIAFLDDSQKDHMQIVGNISEAGTLMEKFPFAICAIGNNEIRLRMHKKLLELGYQVPTLVHANACVSPAAHLGQGCIVRAGAVISSGVEIADACLINIHASIDHGCVIGEGSHIPMGCVVRNEVVLPALSLLRPNGVME